MLIDDEDDRWSGHVRSLAAGNRPREHIRGHHAASLTRATDRGEVVQWVTGGTSRATSMTTPTPTSAPALAPGARLLKAVFRGWQLTRAGRPSPCRFEPSCSSYGIQAVERFGAVRGGFLTLRRLLRCHPWGGVGLDPVPERPARRPRGA